MDWIRSHRAHLIFGAFMAGLLSFAAIRYLRRARPLTPTQIFGIQFPGRNVKIEWKDDVKFVPFEPANSTELSIPGFDVAKYVRIVSEQAKKLSQNLLFTDVTESTSTTLEKYDVEDGLCFVAAH
jgi:hypothetical protein